VFGLYTGGVLPLLSQAAKPNALNSTIAKTAAAFFMNIFLMKVVEGCSLAKVFI
jgi:hypothetical protein